MRILYELTPKALDDLDEIWLYIAQDDRKAADRVESAILAACRSLSRFPGLGKPRNELTSESLRFWTVPKYPNYFVVYWPERSLCKLLRFCTVAGTLGRFFLPATDPLSRKAYSIGQESE